jgi:Restriction endonuclease
VLFFYHPDQTVDNQNYFKGKLFEQVLKGYLEKLGYDVELRQKRNSLEYDLSGRARLGGIPLVGEAKAHGRSISGEMLSSFVGKVYPFHSKDQRTIGIYLSTSALTPDAEDYRRSLDPTQLNLLVSTGDELLSDISRELGLPREDTVKAAITKLGAYPLATHYLMTDRGLFLLQISATSTGATPALFSIMREDGVLIADPPFLDALKAAVPELGELEALYPSIGGVSLNSSRTEIQEGLILGTEWADYRLPASPEFFVGRQSSVDRIVSLIKSSDAPGVLQVKSRSGVGKSSLMAFLQSKLAELGYRSQLFDTRNIKSIFDLFSVVQRFTGSSIPPSDVGSMESQIGELARMTPRSVLLFDQFESTFGDPELFDAYEAIALSAVQHRPNITVVFARKNDLLTTYDNSRISLERLNGLSESILLILQL